MGGVGRMRRLNPSFPSLPTIEPNRCLEPKILPLIMKVSAFIKERKRISSCNIIKCKNGYRYKIANYIT